MQQRCIPVGFFVGWSVGRGVGLVDGTGVGSSVTNTKNKNKKIIKINQKQQTTNKTYELAIVLGRL